MGTLSNITISHKAVVFLPFFIVCVSCFPPTVFSSSCESDPEKKNHAHGNVAGFHEKLIDNGLNDIKTPISSDQLGCFNNLFDFDPAGISDMIFVDTRGTATQKNRIAHNAIAIPVSLLPRKTFLLKKHVILIHDSYDYYTLLDTCVKMKNLGFKNLSVLTGGINRWDSISLEANSNAGLNLISPQDLYALSLNGMWSVFEITDTDNPIKPDNLTQINTADISKLQPVLDSSISQYARKHEHLPNVLIASQNGDDYSAISKTLTYPDFLNVFYLDGGVTGFNRFSKTHSALMNKKMRNEDNIPPCEKLY
jgi:hypothetical protein